MRFPHKIPLSQVVYRTLHAPAASLEHVRVNHRRADVAVPEKLLDRADVVAALQQVRRARMPEAVAGGKRGGTAPSAGYTSITTRFEA